MKNNLNKLNTIKTSLLLFSALITHNICAQQFSEIKFSEKPLILQSQGSFYVGGEKKGESQIELGGFSPSGNITVNQMYVHYMKPASVTSQTPSIVLVHGMNLSGKCWETTPDGRMGWDEYIVRKGYPVYIVDQIGVGRSGFDQQSFNAAKNNLISSEEQPSIIRISDENTRVNFRFTQADNTAVKNGKFPLDYSSELSKQNVPFPAGTIPNPNPNYTNLAELSSQINNTILISHSQSGAFPIEAALVNTDGIKAMILLEPGGTGSRYTQEEIQSLSNIPILVIFGDHLNNETGIPGHSWNNYYKGWGDFVKKINDIGGNAEIIHLPEINIYGNSHMLMMDNNNLEIADIILKWIDRIRK